MSGDDKNKKSIIWCLYHDNEIKEEGVDTDPCVFVDVLKRVHANDGFVVWFGLDKKYLFFWLRDNLSEEDYGMWNNLKKCQLHDFELYVKVDKVVMWIGRSLNFMHRSIQERIPVEVRYILLEKCFVGSRVDTMMKN